MKLNNFEKLKKKLVCPKCRGKLESKESFFTCFKCNSIIAIKNDKFYFIELDQEFKKEDWFDKLKTYFKQNKKLYDFIISVISPVFTTINRDVKKFVKEIYSQNKEAFIVNVGSGPFRFDKTYNLDVFDYGEVDLVADASKMPFLDSSVDGIINIAVLEHVKNPEEIVKEIKRVLKKNGEIFVFIPFIQGFHASPYDYFRWTRSGAKEMFKEFSDVKVIDAEGPSSALLWIFQEWFAIMFSFGSKTLYKILLLLVMGLTWPFKFLDVFLRKHPLSSNITAGFYVLARK